MMRSLYLFLLTATSALGVGLELSDSAPAREIDEAFPTSNGTLIAYVHGSPQSEEIRLEALSFALDGSQTLDELRTEVLAGAESGEKANPEIRAPREHIGSLWIDFLDGDLATTRYRRSLNLGEGTANAYWRRDGASFTMTTMVSDVDDVIIVHLLANMPGALGFRVRLTGPKGNSDSPVGMPTGNRGELRLVGPDFTTHAWAVPFESEVAPVKEGMAIRGEGEAMIVISTSKDPTKAAAAFTALAAKYDGRDEHPDFGKLWHSAFEAHQKRRQALIDKTFVESPSTSARLWQTLALPDVSSSGLPGDRFVRTHDNIIEFLPDLPKYGKSGKAQGLPIPGGLNAEMEWENKKVVRYHIHRNEGLPALNVKVREPSGIVEVLAK
jgi:hypothetical protein